MLIIELNEFDPNYLKEVSKELDLNNIRKIFNLKHSNTFTDQKEEFQGLDPWVQWVSIHTGKPFKEHKICRLSDTKRQKFKQIWNAFGENNNYSCGIWGVMNAPCGNKKGIKFFVPDPWSFDEIAKPKDLNDFLSLPRYMAKNYLSISIKKFVKESFKMLRFLIQNRGNGKTRKFIKVFIKSIFIAGINIHTLTTLLDFLSTLYFIELKNKYGTNFNIIFLNHIAHIQHQFWNLPNKEISNQMKFALLICNEIMGLLIDSLDNDEEYMIINGLRQKLVKGEGFFTYRQKDPISFFNSFGIKSVKTEQNMTNDGILVFSDKNSKNEAIDILKTIHLKKNGEKVFYIDDLDDKRIFYQFKIKNRISGDDIIQSKERKFKFYDLVECICERTGAHLQEGDIFFKGFKFPKKIYNHEIYNYLVNAI